jgi:SAM-dependent methyltransferase
MSTAKSWSASRTSPVSILERGVASSAQYISRASASRSSFSLVIGPRSLASALLGPADRHRIATSFGIVRLVTGDHVARNRASWDADANDWVERGRRNWASHQISWGIWDVPEADLHLLPDVRGLDVVELGCGTAYVSAWLARLGARPVGLDNSGRQLATARMLQDEFGLRFPLVHADAERAPFRDGSFDLAVSEYGAAIWCDPYAWIPEAARLLRPGGRLAFLGNSYLEILTIPDEGMATETLLRDHFGLHRFEWPDSGGSVTFSITHGEMIRLLRTCGFEVEGLVEVRAPEDATGASPPGDPLVTAEWSRRWPAEEAWLARKGDRDHSDGA